MSIIDVIEGRARWHIEEGDSAAVAQQIPSESIDAIVADPPSGIKFMGREWDSDKGGEAEWIAWLAGILTEGFRVLKPGGHCLLWALPRTSDWTMQALRRAGFEVRDVIVHLQGAGFPKSLSVEKAIGGDAGKAWEGWGTSLKPANERWIRAQKPFAELDHAATISARLEELEALVCSEVAKRAAQSSRPSHASSRKAKAGSALALVAIRREDGEQNGTAIGGADASSEATDMSRSRSLETVTPLSIVSSWRRTWGEISERMSTCTIETASSLITDLRTLRSSLLEITPESIILDAMNPSGAPSPASVVGQLFDALKTRCDTIQTRAADERVLPSPRAGAESRSLPAGLATQVGIGSEDWILARKPLAGTVASNVLAHGTGALNIDGCRVGTDAGWSYPNGRGGSGWQGRESLSSNLSDPMAATAGRFPANLVLSHTAWEETHCPCGAVLSFVARFCPECGSSAVEHRRAGCCEAGERRVRSPGGDADYSPTGVQGPTSVIRNVKTGAHHGDPDGLETVTAWECLATCACGLSTLAPSGGAAPRCRCGRAMAWGCAVARLDEQSGESRSPSTYTRSAGAENKIYGAGAGTKYTGEIADNFGDSGGSSRFFNCFSPPGVEEPFWYDIECQNPTLGDTCESQRGDGIASGASPVAGESSPNSKAAGRGSKPTARSQKVTKSTTSTTTTPTTDSKISNASPSSGTTTTTNGSAKIIGQSTESSNASASDATSGRHSANTTFGEQAHTADTANSALPNTCDPGARVTPNDGRHFWRSSGPTEQPSEYVEPFLYSPKPSTAEREAGCERLPLRSAAELVDREEGSAGMDNPRAGAGRVSSGRRNSHPTLKSVALMRHLVRLVTPPGGIVLDLFGGSGTTVCAAVLEGFRAVAIELSPEYVAIARARVAFWARLAGTKAATVDKPRPTRERPSGQGSLW